MKSSGWKIASHCLYKDMGEEEERAQIAEAIRLHTKLLVELLKVGTRNAAQTNIVRLTAETGRFAYVADSYADDLPYWT